MKHIATSLLALALLGAAGHAHAAQNCTIKLAGNDAMQFDQKSVTVSASCPKITIQLAHTGKLAANVMGHNVIVSQTADMAAVTAAALKAGAAAGYVPKDPKVIGETRTIGGGQTTTGSFPGSKLKAGGDYSFYCSFPGHSSMMKGKLVVTK